MAIPDYQTIMLPLLRHISDGNVHAKQDVVAAMAKHFGLSEEELGELVPSGTPLFGGRVHWAIQYMLNAGLVLRPERARVQITDRGREFLAKKPDHIDNHVLAQFPEFEDWRTKSQREKAGGRKSKHQADEKVEADRTPEEMMSDGFDLIQNALSTDLLDKVKSCSPRFFERLVLQLLLKMGYGGSIEGAGQVVGKTGDGGIDGIIKEDKLGLDIIYIQAKRWEGVVSVVEVRNFSGSLDPHGAKKGVFITTSSFTKDARDFVTRLGEKKIVLIDGFELAQLMIDHDIGVSTVEIFPIKRLDSDYFEE
jgi:restriction system protein